MKRLLLLIFLCPLGPLAALGYNFVYPGHPVHFDGYWASMGKAKFHAPGSAEGSHLLYAEGGARGVFNYFFNKTEALALTVADLHMTVDWHANPKFHQKQFNDALFAIGLVSRRPTNWLWLVEGGFRIDTRYFHFNQYALYFGTLWGQYKQTDNLTLHIGMTGNKGIKSSYMLPILGLEWIIKNRVEFTLVMPIEASIAYLYTPRWNSALTYRGFGGRYRANHRVGPDEPLPKAVFEIHSTGLDIGLNYRGDLLRFNAVGGWNFGGWLYIQNSEGHHGIYYKYKESPYLAASFSLTF